MRVAAGQAVAVSGEPEANVATAVRLVELAATQEVRLLVLPEAFLTGYDVAVFASGVPEVEAVPALLAPLRDAAAAHGMVVVLSSPLRRPHAVTMSMLVVREDGSVTAPYDKQHLDEVEAGYFSPGDHGASILVDGLEFGLGICYDTSFPEHARHAADGGAVGYLASAAFFPGSSGRRDLALAARAADNVMYVVAACATGTTGEQDFVGGSAVYDPDGLPLARLGEEEGLAVADLDLEVVLETRQRRRLALDRPLDLGGRVRE